MAGSVYVGYDFSHYVGIQGIMTILQMSNILQEQHLVLDQMVTLMSTNRY